jgi:AcrR family transcriptional regulator
LIVAGRNLFAQRGFDGTSVRAITEKAGVNLGSVTYHFGSKGGLYGAVLEAGLRPIATGVREAAASSGVAMERVLRVLDVYFEHLNEFPDLPRLLLQEVAAGKTPPAPVLEIMRQVLGTLTRLYEEGVRDGSIRPGHPTLTALSVVSQPIYLALVTPLLRDVGGLDLSEPATRGLAAAHVRSFVQTGLDPIRGTD